jgi:dTMP kinase
MSGNTFDIPVLCVTGGDASGKSTQVAALCEALRRRGVRAAAVGIWDGLGDPATSAGLPFADREAVYGYLRVLGPRGRASFLFHALHVAIELAAAQDPGVIVLNAHWYKYFATEVAHGADAAELRAWTRGFPEPGHTFHLMISADTALARKAVRSDYESGYGDELRFLDFQRRSRAVLDELSAELEWTELDGTRDPAELTDAMLTRLSGEFDWAAPQDDRMTVRS